MARTKKKNRRKNYSAGGIRKSQRVQANLGGDPARAAYRAAKARGFEGTFEDWVKSLNTTNQGGGADNSDEPAAPTDPAKDKTRYDPAKQATIEAPVRPEIAKTDTIRFSSDGVRDVDLNKVLAPEIAPTAGKEEEKEATSKTPRSTTPTAMEPTGP